jgi:peptidoglycan-associated lipoprotein
MMKSAVIGLAVVAFAGGVLLTTTGCGPKPKKEAPTVNLDSIRAAEEAKRRADSIAAAEAARLKAEADAKAKAEMEAARLKAEAEAKDKATIKIIYFDLDKSNIRKDMSGDLTFDAGVIKKYAAWKVQLEGHADERGSTEYNLALGDRRAQSVKKFLTDYGIGADKITTISYGKERPAAQGHNEAAWSKNRRVEFNLR